MEAFPAELVAEVHLGGEAAELQDLRVEEDPHKAGSPQVAAVRSHHIRDILEVGDHLEEDLPVHSWADLVVGIHPVEEDILDSRAAAGRDGVEGDRNPAGADTMAASSAVEVGPRLRVVLHILEGEVQRAEQ